MKPPFLLEPFVPLIKPPSMGPLKNRGPGALLEIIQCVIISNLRDIIFGTSQIKSMNSEHSTKYALPENVYLVPILKYTGLKLVVLCYINFVLLNQSWHQTLIY